MSFACRTHRSKPVTQDRSIIAKFHAARKSSAAKRAKFRNAAKMAAFPVSNGSRGSGGVFRRHEINVESPVHQRQVGGLEPTVAREHVCGPDVISTVTVKGAREGARVEIMSVGCPQTAGRASMSGQAPDYLSRNTPRRVRACSKRRTTAARNQTVPLFFFAQIAWRATPSMSAASSFVTTPRENTRWKPCMKWSACSGFMNPIS